MKITKSDMIGIGTVISAILLATAYGAFCVWLCAHIAKSVWE